MEVKKIVEGMTAPQVAQVIDDNFKAQNAILEEDIAKQNNVIGVSEYKDFSEAEAVNVGDVRKYDGLLYECVEATTGAFDASKWKKSSFKAETEKKLAELGSKIKNIGVGFNGANDKLVTILLENGDVSVKLISGTGTSETSIFTKFESFYTGIRGGEFIEVAYTPKDTGFYILCFNVKNRELIIHHNYASVTNDDVILQCYWNYGNGYFVLYALKQSEFIGFGDTINQFGASLVGVNDISKILEKIELISLTSEEGKAWELDTYNIIYSFLTNIEKI